MRICIVMHSGPPSPGRLSRRDFLKVGALASLAVGGSRVLGAGAPAVDGGPGNRPRNVIVVVSDGMSIGALTMADQFLQWRDGRSSNWLQLYGQPGVRRGLMDMASADNMVTDSAAAASAWGCGKRVNNGSINVGANGEEWEPILKIAAARGQSTGLVTTATVTHATPAGFAANVASRKDEETIAVQYLERGYSVIMGGGSRFFLPATRADGRDLLGDFRAGGYHCPETASQLAALPSDQAPLLGLFGEKMLPYEIDRLHDQKMMETVPSLADMSRVALERLKQNPEGFILQIEGARVDHAAHWNDIGALIFDQLALDEAVAVALQFQREVPDTLVIVTTDHGNANPGLNSGQDGGAHAFSLINNFSGSFAGLDLRKGVVADDIKRRFEQRFSIEISDVEATTLENRLNGDYAAVYRRMNGIPAMVGQVLANHVDVGWVGNSHTSDYVEVCAIGPGSEGLTPFLRNTDLFRLML